MAKKHSVGILCAVNDDSKDLTATLDSVFSQENAPDTHIYIGISEICGKTLDIANNSLKAHPDKVSVKVEKEDKTLADMLFGLLQSATEDYIVICPPGDIFTDTEYLASQSSVLKENSGISGVFCIAEDSDDKTLIPYDIHKLRAEETDVFDSTQFAKYSMVAYSAIMLKNTKLSSPQWYSGCTDPYYPLILMMLGKSRIKLNDRVMVEKHSGFNFFPLERYSENRIRMLRWLRLYFSENYANYCTGTLKKAIIKEVDFAIQEIAGERDVKEVYNEVTDSSNDEYLWLRKHIKKYKITPEQLQLTGNLHREWAKLHNKPMVTVVCITYAHEEFIRQALDSFLMQKTNFKYKVFVGEDNGPDKTADIIREYAEKYPDIIVPFLRKENMGAQRNLIDMCSKAESSYIAFCEGDDYWTDEYKLQKQFDYMESHPTLRSCFHNAEIKVDMENGWFLAEQFKNKNKDETADDDDRMIWPMNMKGFKPKKTYAAGAYIKQGFVHTSSMFFRWNYHIEIPEWYYTHQLGDFTIWLIQLGTGRFGYMTDIMSVYRRHEGGAYYFKNKAEYMLKTRRDWIALLKNLRQYFNDNYFSYKVDVIQERINRETNNLFYFVINNLDYSSFHETVEEVGEEGYSVVRWVYRMMHSQKATLNKIPKNTLWYVENIPGGKEKLEAKIEKIRKRYEKKEERRHIFNYWKYTFSKKDKQTWVFAGFWGNSYMDNTMYLYEYICDNHPEINAVWLSTDEEVVENITSLGRKAYLANTKDAISALKHAYVGFIDHYKMSDFGKMKGLNHRMKIVQLWHGVGIKKMSDIIELSTIKGSQLSPDIILSKDDSLFERIKKRFALIKNAPNRELFEKYLMYVCPGNEMVIDCHKALNIPKKCFFLCGYPRTCGLYSKPIPSGTKKIIYAPTFRWSQYLENCMVDDLIKSLSIIQKTMEAIDGKFIIRFHPHTWRDYNYKLTAEIKKYRRIKIDKTDDVYAEMPNYFAMISDYSSIVYDFLLMNRPLVFHCPDLKFYMHADHDLKYDYKEVSPGPQTESWEETMKAIAEYAENPEKDSDERLRVRDFFYDMSVNDENNCERIVEEVKRRINF